MLRGAVSLIVVLMPAGFAGAIVTNLNGNAQAGSQAGVFQTFSNVAEAELSGVRQQDALGNDAVTRGFLATPTGRFALSTHACSGGAPPALGSASGAANAGVDLVYVVASSTLPPGTPVEIDVRWAFVGRVTVIGTNLANVQDVAQGSLSGQVSISVDNVLVANEQGGYSRRITTFEQPQVIRSGTLNVEEDSDARTVTALVGQTIRFVAQANVGVGSFAFGPAVTDGDVQGAAVWGMSSLTAGASIVLMEEPSQTAPPAVNGTLQEARAILPPRPSGNCECAPDFNCDGSANSQDFFDFLGAFFSDAADFNHDGVTNSQDLFDFLAAFFAGC